VRKRYGLVNEHNAMIARDHVRIALGDLEEGFRLYAEAYERRSGWLMFMRAAATWDTVSSSGAWT
jgi:hypothetical protein